MRLVLAALALLLGPPALAVTGGAPPATGWVARAIVMVIDPDGDLCTGTALARDLVLTAAHCVARKKALRGQAVPDRHRHSGARGRHASALRSTKATRAAAPPPMSPCSSSLHRCPPWSCRRGSRRRAACKVGETLVIAGFGTTADRSAAGLGIPRMARLSVTGQPGSLQIRLVDPATRNARPGLGACTGDSGAPAFDGAGPDKSGQKSGQVIGQIIGVVSWTTAAENEEGCGGLTGLTPLLSYRSWIVDTARKFGAPINR